MRIVLRERAVSEISLAARSISTTSYSKMNTDGNAPSANPSVGDFTFYPFLTREFTRPDVYRSALDSRGCDGRAVLFVPGITSGKGQGMTLDSSTWLKTRSKKGKSRVALIFTVICQLRHGP